LKYLVIDASVTVAWMVEEASPVALRALELVSVRHDCSGSRPLVLRSCNSLITAERKGRATAQVVTAPGRRTRASGRIPRSQSDLALAAGRTRPSVRTDSIRCRLLGTGPPAQAAARHAGSSDATGGHRDSQMTLPRSCGKTVLQGTFRAPTYTARTVTFRLRLRTRL
jgi:hypothetical protein